MRHVYNTDGAGNCNCNCNNSGSDNAIGTMLYGQGMEIRGPIIITQSDPVHDCHSFKTLEDIVRTYVEINNHCGGILIINDEDDGRYDAYA